MYYPLLEDVMKMQYVNISFITFMQFIPPSPVLDFPPTLFIARARVVCASKEMLPKLMAPEIMYYSVNTGISAITKLTINDISCNMCG
jgi:hypothetical protein